MSSKFDIEDGIPLPPVTRGRGPKAGTTFQPRLPLKDLQPGQSLFVPTDECSGSKLRLKINRLSRVHGLKFTTRARTEDGVDGVRVWKVTD